MASTRSYGGEGTPVDEQSLGELVATATRDLSVLVHQEIELAKSELAEQVKRGAIGAGLLAGAGVLALLGFFLGCFAAAFGIAEGGGVPVWAGFLCIAGLFIVVGGVLGFIGVRAFAAVSGPDQTVSTVKSSLASLRHRNGSKPAEVAD
ncbi:MAG TPA: phage holin family protein [Mycobacteriales bacterium]|nr:phage holin family protein [Mycobacteriales bacterium]